MIKKSYAKPVLEYCGPVSERTLGGGGSRPDCGNEGGNNGQGPVCPTDLN